MGIRFRCNQCEKRLNVKATQAGQGGQCPYCDAEILVPLESTIRPRRRRRRRSRRTSNDATSLNDAPLDMGSSLSDAIADSQMPNSISASVTSGISDSASADSFLTNEDSSPATSGSRWDTNNSDSGLAVAEMPKQSPVEENATPVDAADNDSDSGSLDSDGLSGEIEISSTSDAAEVQPAADFKLDKPTLDFQGKHPIRDFPKLIWYVRGKKLGEKGPLKAAELEGMLEDRILIKKGYIVWREDWIDWQPAELVFPELNDEPGTNRAFTDPNYRIPDELNPHSELSRRNRFKKTFGIIAIGLAFVTIILLGYVLIQMING